MEAKNSSKKFKTKSVNFKLSLFDTSLINVGHISNNLVFANLERSYLFKLYTAI